MSQKFNELVGLMNKFVGPLLLVVISTLLTMQLSLGTIQKDLENLRHNFNNHLISFTNHESEFKEAKTDLHTIGASVSYLNDEIQLISAISRVNRETLLKAEQNLQFIDDMRNKK